jgi:hypothetical protein
MHLPYSPLKDGLFAFFCKFILSISVVGLLASVGIARARADSPSPTQCTNYASLGFRAYLPNCRAYEMVSPSYKEGFPLVTVGASEDGSGLLAESFGSFSSPRNLSGFGQSYELVRTGSTWQASPLDPLFSEFSDYHVEAVSPNLQNSLWFASTPAQAPVEDVYLATHGAPPVRMGPGDPPGDRQKALNFVGASGNLFHALFVDYSPQAGETENLLWPGDSTTGEGTPSLYEYEGTGSKEPGLVGVSNVGVPETVEEGKLISNCGTYLGSTEGDAYNAVSDNGATVFFTARECGESPAVDELYARSNREKTIAISEPLLPLSQGSGPGPEECNVECRTTAHKPGAFAGASADGSKVFFLTAQPLLNGAATEGGQTGLYEAEIEGEGTTARIGMLIQVSRDPNAGQAAEVQGVARVSEDGSHVYFVAKGMLTNEPDRSLPIGRQVAVAHADNLYVYERDSRYPDGHIAFVATLSGEDSSDWSSRDTRPAQATPEGGFLVFQSRAELTPDQTGWKEEAGQVFEYDAQTDMLARVSRGQNGYHENGNSYSYSATIPVQNYTRMVPTERFLHLALSNEGSYVFFSSEDRLTSNTLNGLVNLYEYHGGEVALISDGHDDVIVNGSHASELIGTDESGENVFFTTADSLVPQDADTQVDVYDARIDGGSAPTATRVPCSGDSCQTSVSAAPPLLTPGMASAANETGSSMVIPQSHAKPKAKAKAKKRKKARKQRKAVQTTRGRR